ncbi:MAG TPA: flagellar biosynthetic protein FliR [Bacillota bacterium]|nr:flagellar biosynthetic protein FliR [Bacillota bacterium]
MTIEPSTLGSFLLIFVRITSFMVTVPLFSGRQIPAPYKIGLSFVLSILCMGMVTEPLKDTTEGVYILLILKEFFVGIVLGFAANILFYSIQLAGSIIDLQIGFSMANVFDPNYGMTTNLTGRFKDLLAILVLLSTNGHHLLIQGILASFDWISIQNFVPALTDGQVSSFLLECLKKMFIIGFMIATPIIGTLFIVDAALGIVARTVPQMNIFAVGLPIKVLSYFSIYIIILPSFFYLLNILFETMFGSMNSILKLMGA